MIKQDIDLVVSVLSEAVSEGTLGSLEKWLDTFPGDVFNMIKPMIELNNGYYVPEENVLQLRNLLEEYAEEELRKELNV